MPDHGRPLNPDNFNRMCVLIPFEWTIVGSSSAEQGSEASEVLADGQAHRHPSEKEHAELTESSLIPKPEVSEGCQRLREWQHVNGYPQRPGSRDERTIAPHDEMTLDARDRLGDARHEIEEISSAPPTSPTGLR